MSGFVFHPGALTDLTEIWEYIAADDPTLPTAFLPVAGSARRTMPQFPARGLGGRTLHRRWSHSIGQWHPRLPREVPAARLPAERMQVLLEWIDWAAL